MVECELSDVVVGAVDVGGPKNIGWAILSDGSEKTGTDLDAFVGEFAKLALGSPVALGFEAPLFIPIGRLTADLTKQRYGENGRPWSAGAGAAVTTLGLAVVTQVLSQLRTRLPNTRASLEWQRWPYSDDLLIFEAFVSGANHAGPDKHHLDALSAARAFRANLEDLDAANAVTETNVLSLAGACMVRTGWGSPNADLLSQSCLVIRPDAPNGSAGPSQKERIMPKHICICGCGGETKGGKYLPGHDQALRMAIERAAGGLESLRAIMEKHLGHTIEAQPKMRSPE